MGAIRHDPRVRLYVDGDWQDITSELKSETKIDISRGRGSSADTTPPQTCSFEVVNDTLKYSSRNPMSPWFGKLGQNTPTEVMKCLRTDTFSRTVSNDWGVSDTGQSWTGGLLGAGGTVALANWNVALGVGTTSVPAVASFRAALTAERYGDVDYQHDVSLPLTNVTGGDLEPGNVYLRSDGGSNYYLCRVVITATESVTVTFIHGTAGSLATPVTIAGLTHTSAQTLRIRCQAEGNTLRAKVWAATAGEPYDWSITVHDTLITTAGFVGPRNGVAAANTNALPIVFSIDNIRISSPRFAGGLSELETKSDVSNKVRTASLAAAGLLRRLGQGTALVQSVMRRAVLSLNPGTVAYWPCEDDAGAEAVSSGLNGGTPMSYALAVPTFGADSAAFPCTKSLIDFNGALITGSWPRYTPISGQSQIRWLMQIPAAGATAGEIILRLGTEGGNTGFWLVKYVAGGGLNLTVRDRFGADLHNADYGFGINGLARRYSLELTQNGANIDFNLSAASATTAGGVSGTVAASTYGRLTEAMFNVGGTLGATTIGQITVEPRVTPTLALSEQLAAYDGERSVTRLIRLCSENAFPFAYVGDAATSTMMGPQRTGKLLDLVRECAAADAGTLYESRGVVGLSYRTRTSAYAQTPALTLDCAAKELRHPFQPVEDDRGRLNDVTVQMTSGGEARAELTTGRMSTLDPPAGIGRYADPYDANVATLLDARMLAEWLLALGTIDEPRYPNLGIDLDAPTVAALMLSSLDVDADALVRVTNAGTAVGIHDPIDQIIRGYKEVLGNYVHTLSFNAAPASVFGATVLDSDSTRLDAEGSTANEVLDTTETGIDVANALPTLWSTDEEPYDILVGGERATVTVCTGSGAQTFTVTRSVNGVVKGHATGAALQVFNPARLAL